MVLEHVVLRVLPVVGDLTTVVVAHHVEALALRCARAWTAGRVHRLAALADLGLADEAVHLAAVYVRGRVDRRMRPAVVCVRGCVVGRDAAAVLGVGQAWHAARVPCQARDAVRAGVGPEVVIERAVLLHDDHDVLDLLDPRISSDVEGDRRRI